MTSYKFLIHLTKKFKDQFEALPISAQANFRTIIVNTFEKGELTALHPKKGALKDVYSVNFTDNTGVQYRALCTKHSRKSVLDNEDIFASTLALYPDRAHSFELLIFFRFVGTHEYINRLYKLRAKEIERLFFRNF